MCEDKGEWGGGENGLTEIKKILHFYNEFYKLYLSLVLLWAKT